MFDPGCVLHREKSKRKDTDAGVDVVADICFNFSLPPPFAPLWEAAGDHFIVPRTPFRMASNAIHIRPSSKAGFCPIYAELRFNGKRNP
jgi:hypothetical protein